MKNTKIQNLTLIALMTAVTCILGPLSLAIPISPVPLSLTNLAIYLSLMILGCKKGTISCLVYLCIGFVGVPVFSAFSAGPGKLLGPTGGYLIGFIFLALIGGWFVDHFNGQFGMSVVGMILGTIVLYALGTAWLAFTAHLTFAQALVAGVLPYIIGDLIKIFLAVWVGQKVRKSKVISGH